VEYETLTAREESGVLTANIDAPPMNLLGPELVSDLVSLIQNAEADDSVQVLVIKSADPDYFISHVDLARINEYRHEAARLTGEASIAALFRYLSASRLVTIAQIEGRVRGWERVCACLRYALCRAGVGNFRSVRTSLRSRSRWRRDPAPHPPHGPRSSARGDVERRRLRR
jgi:hypothetical protein